MKIKSFVIIIIILSLLIGTQVKAVELNEYIDPSKNPKYYQNYNEIQFGEEGITYKELLELGEIVNILDNPEEIPKVIIKGEEKLIEISMELQKFQANLDKLNKNLDVNQIKILSFSYNSKPEDIKIEEINYLIEKQEDLNNLKNQKVEIDKALKTDNYDTIVPDNKKLDKKDLKNKALKEVEKTTKKIKDKEENIEKNRIKWDAKKIKNKDKINKYNNKITLTSNSSNKELMDIIYPSKEEINKLNQEILDEQKKIKDAKLEEKWKNYQRKQKILSFFKPQDVEAGSLNNFIATLVMYSRDNYNLRIDLMGNNVSYGNQFQIYDVNYTNAQKFKFNDEEGSIRHAQSGWCMDRSGNGYGNGVRVQLWPCNGSDAQKWQAFPDGTIKPLKNHGYCLDGANGLNKGSVIRLWQCTGGA